MSDDPQKKPDNIVKKVFDRSGSKPDKVSALFTHYKNPKAKKEAAQSVKSSPKLVRKGAAPKRMPAILDFGASRIKLFQLGQDGKGSYEVVLMDEEATDPGQGGSPSQVKQALQKLSSRNALGANVIVGIPARETLSYNFTFPAMTDDELREAVKWKIKSLKPFDQEADKIKFTLLKWDTPLQTAAQAQQRVTVVCVSEDNLSQKNTLLTEAGLKSVGAMVSPLALMQTRRFGRLVKASDELVLWLDLGSDESVFIIEKNGVAQYMRNLSITGRVLTRQVAQACHVADVEAEDLKRKYGLESWTPSMQSMNVSEDDKLANPGLAVSMALTSMLENLVVDIEHSFKHFSYQVTQSQVTKFDRVVLTGGSANLKKLDQFLSDHLGVPVTKSEPLQGVAVSEALKAQRKNMAEDALVFASAAGLAFTHLTDKEHTYDLLSQAKKTSSGPLIAKILNQPKIAAAMAAVLLAFLILPQMAALAYYKKQADTFNQQVKQVRGEINTRQSSQLEMAEQEKKLIEKKEMLEEKLSLFRESTRNEKDFSKLLTNLASLLPEEVWVTKLSYVDKKLTLVGATSRNELIVNFLDNLKKPSEFSDVVFNYTQKDATASVYNFEVMMNVK